MKLEGELRAYSAPHAVARSAHSTIDNPLWSTVTVRDRMPVVADLVVFAPLTRLGAGDAGYA
ncbi:hypothetical protein [Kibdelosporangium aridum]|uniref:Uncharacterized protein n=1 Tax=Kibdelosporangium aridum TaxID=2030 RepID=A0A1W2FZA8_KIBAR|nr:hypothetical protein [Kibdelosporangium aridum]SMD26948.1 hypothetical protein SAMN05661093_10535 [Kibdelosporangium aridum]